MAEKFITIPTADLNVDNLPTTLTNAILHDTTSLSGLTNSTAYRAFVLQNPSGAFTPAASATTVIRFDAGTGGLPAGIDEPWNTADITYNQVAGGYLEVVKTGTQRTAINVSGVSFSDGQTMAKVRLVSPVDNFVIGVFGRISGSASTETAAGARFNDGTFPNEVNHLSYNSGSVVESGLSTSSGVTFLDDTWYIVRVELSGTTVRIRLWEDGSTEPATWDIETSIGTIPSGAPGLLFLAPGTSQIEWLSYSDGGVAPFPA